MAETTTPSGADVPDRDAFAELINSHMTGVYHCTRVWEAWNYGTMSESDFIPAGESSLAGEIADEILSTAVAALIAREAEQDKLIAEITNAAADAAIKHRDIVVALAAENKALREIPEQIAAGWDGLYYEADPVYGDDNKPLSIGDRIRSSADRRLRAALAVTPVKESGDG